MTGANGDEDAGKMFIGGVSRETTEDTMRQYFEKYGAVKDCILMTDKATGNSRGFGFVTYSNPSSVEDVMAGCPHTLDNKIIDPKKCTPRHMQQKKNFSNNQFNKTHKIFVGGLSMDANEDDVSTYFTKYGVVTEVVLVADKNDQSRPHKGFGFVTFEDESSVDQAIAKHYHSIKDKRCEAKSAENRDKLQQQKNAQGPGGFNQGMGYDQNKMGGNQFCGPQGGGMPGMNMGYGPQGGMNNMGYPQGGYNNNNGGGGYNNQSFPTAYPQYGNQQCGGYQQPGNYNQGNYNYGAGYGMNAGMPNNGNGVPNMNTGMGATGMGGGPDMSHNQGNGYNMGGQGQGSYPVPGGMGAGGQGRGDMGNYQQQNSSAYGPMRSDYPAANNGGSQPQSIPGNAAVPPNRGGNNYSHGKAAAATTPASGPGYHPYRRM